MKAGRGRVSLLLASPVVVVALLVCAVGTVSATIVFSQQLINNATDEVEEAPVSKSQEVDRSTPIIQKPRNDNKEFGGNILDGVEVDDMLNVIEEHETTKNTGYGMTAEQVKDSESKEAIEGRYRKLGVGYKVSGSPGNYRVDIEHTVNLSQVACDDYPDQSDTVKKRDLAAYYLLSHMPSSLTSGTVTFTIVGDKKTPKQTFYRDPGTSWVRWNEDGGSYMTCNPPQDEE